MSTNITESYESHTKDELLAEAETRGVEGVNHSSLKADIIAALELNDEQSDKAPKVTPPLPAPQASNIPQVSSDEVVSDEVDGIVFRDEDFTDGHYVMRKGAHVGETFALYKHEPDTYAKTHSLKNSQHFWQGNEAEFAVAFEKA